MAANNPKNLKAEQENPPVATAEKDKLVKLGQGKGKNSPAVDLNSKLSRIEINLTGLTRRLESTDTRLMNLHFEMKSQKRIEGRIEETHAELQEMQLAYQELIRQAARLGIETNHLAVDLKTQSERLTEQDEEQSQLKRRTELLESKTTQLGESLDSIVTGLNATVQTMETRFSEQIGAVEKASRERDQELAGRIDRIANGAASALHSLANRVTTRTDELDAGLRQTNEDITTLFGSVNDLSTHTDDLQQQVGVLDVRSQVLEERSDELEHQDEQQQRGIAALFDTTRRHFQWATASLIILLLITAGLGYYQSSRWEQEAAANAQLNKQLAVQNELTLKNSNDLAAIENLSIIDHAAQAEATKALNTELQAQQEKLAQLQEKIHTIEDKSDSANGRLSAMAPHRQFGDDNIIHGPAWLAQQDPNSYVIRLTTVSDKSALYETAQRWSHYLKDTLAYYETGGDGSKQYVLVYGSFKDMASARQSARGMPPLHRGARPRAEQLQKLQERI